MRKGEDPPWIVADSLWERIEPLLPKVERRSRYPGRRRLDDRKVLCGILFVLHTGIRWEFLPKELGFGSGMTCWRRLSEWHEAGVWGGPTPLDRRQRGSMPPTRHLITGMTSPAWSRPISAPTDRRNQGPSPCPRGDRVRSSSTLATCGGRATRSHIPLKVTCWTG